MGKEDMPVPSAKAEGLVSIVEGKDMNLDAFRGLMLRSLGEDAGSASDTGDFETLQGLLDGDMPDGSEGESRWFFAKEGGRFVGMLCLAVPEGSTTARVEHAYFEPGEAGRDAARHLLERGLDALHDEDVVRRIVFRAPENDEFRSVYESVGFHAESEVFPAEGEREGLKSVEFVREV